MDVFDVGVAALLLVDEDGRVRRQSRGWSIALDWPSDLVGTALLDHVVPDHHHRVQRALDHTIPGAAATVVRARALRPGSELVVTLRMERVDDGLLVSVEDSSRRAVVLEGSSHLQTLVDFASDAWLVHDLDGNMRDCNPWACESLGYTREELLALQASDIETTIQPGRLDGVWNRMELGRPVTVQGRQRRKDGSTFPVEVRLGLFETSDDEVLMLAVARDATEREEHERRLLALNEDLERQVRARTAELADTLAERQRIVDQLAHGVLGVTSDGTIRLANPAAAELLGARCDVGTQAFDILPDNLVELLDNTMEVPQTAEFTLPSGGVGLATASSLDAGGMVLALRDVSLEREVDRMKTDFIATVSHELRTPLTSVLGFAKLTASRLEERVFPLVEGHGQRTAKTVEQLRRNLGIIVSEGDRLTQLINDVLDISKMEAGRMDWSMEAVEVATLVRRATDAAAPLFHDATVRLEVDVSEGLALVKGDADRLQQVLLNLLSNARKFTRRGAVTVSAQPVATGIELAVRDTGEGIPEKNLSTIFDRFRQLGDTLTDKPRGTGLGLPICQQIAAAHGTTIQVASTVGTGSRFAMVLPYVGSEAPTPVPSEPPRLPGLDDVLLRIDALRRRPRPDVADILVVDDDPNLRDLLHQQLTARGHRVTLAADGMEAIESVREHAPDLVILDVMMPKLSGFDVAALLKNDPQTRAIPIVVLSIVRDEERGLRLGVDRYLTKPIQEESLAEAIDELLSARSRAGSVLLVLHDDAMAAALCQRLERRGYEVTTAGPEDAAERTEADTPELVLVDAAVPGRDGLVQRIRAIRGIDHVQVVHLM